MDTNGISALFKELGRLLLLGGFVMPPLVVGAVVLWYGLGYRLFTLVFIPRLDAHRLLERARSDFAARRERPTAGIMARAASIGLAVVRKLSAGHDPLASSQAFLSKTRSKAAGTEAASTPAAHYHTFLEEAFYPCRKELSRFSRMVSSVVRTAPLAGLLGTVSGMIGTFDALGDPTALVDASTGVAGGISEALFSTEMGLIVAIPGLIIGRLLDRREQRLMEELTKLQDLLVLEASSAGALGTGASSDSPLGPSAEVAP